MHHCPDCGEECNCGCDTQLVDDDCEHVCAIYEKDYEDEDFYEYDDDSFCDEDF